ncbi:MAG: nitrogenase cofactor biosynthesis protein NifB [Firmicutes bacterium HGW-Firmicutes-8]|nr:MAG: nitrogenase cofactor biosynthesis protein NifB [Firmicutes bacterium HGW-Firmicutes-8]
MDCSSSCNNSFNLSGLSSDTLEKTNRHPCYSFEAHRRYARMHLPVAPNCNISCNYCNRKFDCLHESRPGVTSEILTPFLALQKFKAVREKIENLSVVGIAGPGDALANWDNTKLSIELIREHDQETVFCLSTNGLMLPDYAPEIVGLGVNHVTVTVNCLEPETGENIYRYVNYKGTRYTGPEGVGILIKNQLAGVEYLAQNGVLVKVNVVMIKDINDRHIPDVVRKVKDLGAFMTNIMPLIPAPGSAFENYPQTSMKELNKMRDICQIELKQMRHCRQCRADAIGMLDVDRSGEFAATTGYDEEHSVDHHKYREYKIAVASKYGKFVDQHFGHASEFTVYQGNVSGFRLLEKRPVEKYCAGMEECDLEESRRDKIVDTFKDCDAILSMRIGYHARKRLADKGIISVETCEKVKNGLNHAVQILNDNNREIA